MDENLCRACLAPQGKVKYSSIFTDNGKIAKEIFKLTNLIVSIEILSWIQVLLALGATNP